MTQNQTRPQRNQPARYFADSMGRPSLKRMLRICTLSLPAANHQTHWTSCQMKHGNMLLIRNLGRGEPSILRCPFPFDHGPLRPQRIQNALLSEDRTRAMCFSVSQRGESGCLAVHSGNSNAERITRESKRFEPARKTITLFSTILELERVTKFFRPNPTKNSIKWPNV